MSQQLYMFGLIAIGVGALCLVLLGGWRFIRQLPEWRSRDEEVRTTRALSELLDYYLTPSAQDAAQDTAVPEPTPGHVAAASAPPQELPEQQHTGDECSDGQPLALGAPVEVWFDDTRIGVRPGSETHERFRKCADALLDDLKAARNDSR